MTTRPIVRTITTTVDKIRPGDMIAQYRMGAFDDLHGMSVVYVTDYGGFQDIGLEGNGTERVISPLPDHAVRVTRVYL